MTPATLPWMAALVTLAGLTMPMTLGSRRPPAWVWLALVGLSLATLVAASPASAFGLVAATGLVQASVLWANSRTAAAAEGLVATLALAAGLAAGHGWSGAATACSLLAIAIRAGVPPLHPGLASLCERAPAAVALPWATLLPLVLVHARFTSGGLGEGGLPVAVVGIGAATALASGLLALTARDLRALYRTSTDLHAGLVLAGVAAGAHAPATAVVVAATSALTVSGFGSLLDALETRTGRVRFDEPGGRIQTLPVLGTTLGLFLAAGVSMPGTLGFVGDDLLLHATGLLSAPATVAAVLAPALLAVASLIAFSRTFFGRPPFRRLAPDLHAAERLGATAGLLVLIVLGLRPSLLTRDVPGPAAPALHAAVRTPGSPSPAPRGNPTASRTADAAQTRHSRPR